MPRNQDKPHRSASYENALTHGPHTQVCGFFSFVAIALPTIASTFNSPFTKRSYNEGLRLDLPFPTRRNGQTFTSGQTQTEEYAMANPIPKGFHTVTPSIVVNNAREAIDFYKKAFGAQELSRMLTPDNKTVVHAELKIGDSIIFLSDEFPNSPVKAPTTLDGSTVALNIYVEDVDRSFKKALDAGGKEEMPVTDMFWGDRYGKLADPFGHSWGILTHKEDLTPQEIEENFKTFWAQMQKQQPQRKTA
jgi:PhnB protein